MTLSEAPTENVTFLYTTVNGSALAGQDYTAGTDSISFALNDLLTRVIRIPVIGDDVTEGDEFYTVGDKGRGS